MIISFLILHEVVKHRELIYTSLGVAVTPTEGNLWILTQTFLPDIVMLVVATLLFVG